MTTFKQLRLFTEPVKAKPKPLVNPNPPRESLGSFLSPSVMVLIQTKPVIVKR